MKSPKLRLRAQADKLAGDECRSRGRCEAKGLDHLECKGALQWCHIVERSHLGLRWSRHNCLCMCQAHHLLYTYRPFRWVLFIIEHFPMQWEYVVSHQRDTFDGDYTALIARLREEQE